MTVMTPDTLARNSTLQHTQAGDVTQQDPPCTGCAGQHCDEDQCQHPKIGIASDTGGQEKEWKKKKIIMISVSGL